MSGPRDWSPASYWDEASARSAPRAATQFRRPSLLLPVLSIVLGLFAIAWPLAMSAPSAGVAGFAVTSAGVSAASLALTYRHRGGYRILSTAGITLGIIGTGLCIWSLAAFYAPANIPALPNLREGSASASALVAQAPPQVQVAAHSSRVVEPFEGANVTAPDQQLHANLVHVALALGVALDFERSRGALPAALSVAADGTVSSPSATYSKIADYMSIEYGITPEGFALTVRDTASGMAVGLGPGTHRVVER